MGVKVTTENNVVYLMGLVTPQEAELATEKTRSVAGVKEVVRLFDFVQ
jgi:osmotically-inducible protein OsmY